MSPSKIKSQNGNIVFVVSDYRIIIVFAEILDYDKIYHYLYMPSNYYEYTM
jgi:hypothetical protein